MELIGKEDQIMDENKKITPDTDTVSEQTPAPAPKKRRISRKLRYGTTSTVLTVVVIAGILLLNVVVGILGDRYPLNLDLTADDTFTLSEDGRKVISGVTNEVEVIVFQDEAYYSAPSLMSDDLNTIARQFYEAMKQCTALSNGKITTRYINYADNPTLVSKYAEYDVNEDSILFLSGERYSVASLMDMFTYDQESYYYYGEVVVTASQVEQAIATNLRKVSGELAPVVILTGHNEDAYTLRDVKAVLGNNAYETVECDLTKTEEIDVDAITMVIPAPATDYSAAEIVKIREWLQQNGEYSRNLVLLTNYKAYCPNLYELINEEYGIEVTRQVVYETSSYFNSNFAAYGTIQTSDFTSEIADEKALSLYTQQLILHKENNTDLSIYNVPLVTFGSSARLVDLDAETTAEEVKPYKADNYPVVGAAYAHKQVPSPTANMTVDSYVMVFGSSAFLDTELIPFIGNAENEEAFMTAFNSVSGSSQLTTISSRTMSSTLLTYEDGVAKAVGIGVFTVAIPVATLAIGLIVFLRRRHL